MEKNNSSNSSMCRKIRQALATSPVVRVIQRVSSRHEEPKPVKIDSKSQPSSPAPTNNTAMKTKTPLPQHLSVNTERAGEGAIPINFDYSTPTSLGNGNHHHHRHNRHDHHGVGVRSEHQGRDINHTFSEYIRHAKHKIRTFSNIGGGGQSNPLAAPDHEANNSTDKKENHQNDHFSDFIQVAKNKLRTSMKRG